MTLLLHYLWKTCGSWYLEFGSDGAVIAAGGHCHEAGDES